MSGTEQAAEKATQVEATQVEATQADAAQAAAPAPAEAAPVSEPEPPPAPAPTTTPATLENLAQEALLPPTAIDDVAAFVPRPGSPAAQPAVQAARAEAEAAREALKVEIARLRAAGRDAIDVKAKVKRMPAAIARDPAKFVGLTAASTGAAVLVSRLRGRGKKAMPPGLLPPEVEAALKGVGPDGEQVREALNSSFTSYLEASGAQRPSRRRKVKGIVPLFILPVASTVTREAIKRAFAQGRKP